MLKKILFTATLIFTFLLGILFFVFETNWVDISSLECYSPLKSSVVLDENGIVLSRFNRDKRKLVRFEDLPKNLVNAFVAAEDHKFFEHSGISIKGIIRSCLVNLYHRRIVQGASTITQQIVKLMFLSPQKTFWRKLQEVFLSFQIERQFTKEQIFEMYVNNVYFGTGIYGVEAAAQRFWEKSVRDVTIDEAATLAAVAKSALYYSPLNSLEASKRRRNIVLNSMRLMSIISEEEFRDAYQKELTVKDYIPGNKILLYIQEWVRLWAEQNWGKDVLYKKSLKIKTTINKNMQDIAEKLFNTKIEELRLKLGEQVNGGMLAIDSSSGKIKVCIGGYDFRQSQFNRAFYAVRQTGSSFKPIVFTAALQKGISFDTVMVDEPFELEMDGGGVWKPKNWTRRFDGAMTLARALSYSNNIITVKTFLETGAEQVINLAKRFGYHRELYPYPSLSLGTAEATVEENVAAFNVFANNGKRIQPFMVEWVKDELGSKIWEHEPEEFRVLDSKTNSQMVNVLSLRLDVTKKIVGEKNWIQAEVIGKTGSTNEAVTTWYVGSTPELTTAVYIGRDDSKPMGRYVFGRQTTFPIWVDFNKALTFNKKHFYIDPELKEVCIDWVTGKKVDDDCKNSVVLVQ
jgi:penicillin-binding protein 1A